jgi:HEAT repeat protein
MRFLASRPGLFVVAAFLLALQNTYASTLVASLFLARIGSHGLPLYYVLFASVSVPVAALFSSVIDRFPRPLLFVNFLALFTLITIALVFVLVLGGAWAYVAFLAVRISEHMILSVFYIMFADYFTVTAAKQYAGRLALGMAVGGLSGGALLTAVTGIGGPIIAAAVTPVLVAAAWAYGGWMTRRHHPLDAGAPASRESVVDSLRILPQLLRRYPLIALMAAAMFLNILLQCVAEFLAFSIYTANFPKVDELAVFLGLVNAGLNLLAFLTIILFTDRQLPRLGIPKMNRVYPALDVVIFGVLTAWPSLPAGILANTSYDPFERGIDVPVATMNYNGIRYRFVGRVRVFIDGMMFPLGLAAAGLLLIGFQGRLDLRAIAAFGLVMSFVLLVLHWNIGREYARGLIEMLRDGAVDLETVESGLRVPPDHVDEIRAMLAGDPRTALIGLQMAARCDGGIPAAEIGAALAKLPVAQARSALAQFVQSGNAACLEALAEIGSPEIRQLAWERILVTEDPAIAERAALLIADPDPGVRCIAAARLLFENAADERARTVLRGAVPAEAALGAIEILRHGRDPMLVPVMAGFSDHAEPAIRASALGAAAALAPDDPAVLAWARRASADLDPAIRRAAFSVLPLLCGEDQLAEVAASGFRDPSPEVRRAAVEGLGARGDAAASAILPQLHDHREAVQLAAIDALGLAKGPAAGDLLFGELDRGVFATVPLIRRLGRSFPRGHPGWPAIRAALDNARRRTIRLVLHALDALGHRRTLHFVRLMITSPDQRSRANAVESLASLPQRRFVIPVLPLIESSGAAEEPPIHGGNALKDLLGDALASFDPWLRAAAAVAWHAETGQIPDRLAEDGSPIVVETVRALAERPTGGVRYSQEPLMSRLAFLHEVPLFAEASLDDLIAVDHALGSETYLAGEAIVTEGESGDRLCIIYRGEVLVRKEGVTLARLTAGDFFGEMSLFDAEPRSATVTAIDEVEVLVLQRDRFHSLVQQRPSILMQLCTTLVRRLRLAEQSIPAAAPPVQAAE